MVDIGSRALRNVKIHYVLTNSGDLNSSKVPVMIYDTDSHPYDISYEEWIRRWWKWLISIQKVKNPGIDSTGKLCGTDQDNPHVWFLAGTFGGRTYRKCIIPYGRAILFPIINYECSFADAPSLRSEEELEKHCRHEIDQIGDIYASVDGKKIDVQNYRVKSKCFTVDVPPNNCLDAINGTTRIASDGYWLFIEPLPTGSHVLKSFGSCLAGKIKICCTFRFTIK